jgi:hypothetical protein
MRIRRLLLLALLAHLTASMAVADPLKFDAKAKTAATSTAPSR